MSDGDGRPTAAQYRGIVVVDRFPLIRTTITHILGQSDAAAVVGEAGSLKQALDVCREQRPDVVISDVDLAERGDGIELCRRVKTMPAPPSVLIFASTNDPQTIADCVASGADSFVHRSAQLQLLVSAVEMLHCGSPLWFPGNRADALAKKEQKTADDLTGSLTERESEILLLILMRYSNKEIADRLFLAHQTVKNYTRNIFQKFGVASRHELVSRHGVVPALGAGIGSRC